MPQEGMSKPTDHPVAHVKWVPVTKVEANTYNPNQVATTEMSLLLHSIRADGFTQPVVVYRDDERDCYVIVDGFHRYRAIKENVDIAAMTGGKVPIVVIEKDLADRMASTVRHNRARGKHSMDGMANLVFGMLDSGMSDEQVCTELGMGADELVRLKYVTGFAKLFENAEYRRAWESRKQLEVRRDYQEREREREKAA